MDRFHFFTTTLIDWDEAENKREMPWKGENDPYKIWLSEIILQQTRVAQGLSYYNKFISTYPTVTALANAHEQEVYKMWEGLGYYSRCKNLLATAKAIVTDYQGNFPANFDSLLTLKGIGNYTAAAIASFAFNLPHAVLDGNVYRVLSRYFGIYTPIDSTAGKKEFTALSSKLLNRDAAAKYNQAIMDLGAEICKPQVSLCESCPLQNKCIAYKKDLISILPIKEKKVKQTERWFYYLKINTNKGFYVRKRSGGDIWENLFEYFLIERNKSSTIKEIMKSKEFKALFDDKKYIITSISEIYKQKLTHQLIKGQFIDINCDTIQMPAEYELIEEKNRSLLPFPKFITSYLTDKNVSLNLSKSA